MSYSNIKVCCRFRPKNQVELKEEAPGEVIKYDGNSVIAENINRDTIERFNFDYVFGENSTQEEVFNTAATPIVEDMLKGYNCTLFVYGQSGTGKTFSISGTADSEPRRGDNKGLTQRIVEKIFNHIYTSDEDCEFTVSISYIEIYLEKIRDLLNPSEENLPLRESESGVYIQGVVEEYTSSYEDVITLFNFGNENRSVGETKMNQKSSRSHSVFLLTLSQVTKDLKVTSKLVLVDLAGSEKIAKTGATGLLLKQAQHTNKSLTTLGIVIRSLIDNSSHVPYRDSKLTRILSDSLGGNSKTCLIVTCSLSPYNIEETLSTLRFGTAVKTIKNKPYKNVEKSVKEYKRLLEEAHRRIDLLEENKAIKTIIDEENEKNKKEIVKLKEEIVLAIFELDKLRVELESKENEVEILTNLLHEKEAEVTEKENSLVKARRISISPPEGNDLGVNKQYYQRLLENKQEMIGILEVALRNSEEIIKTQRYDYEKLKRQADDFRRLLTSPNISKTIIVPVRRFKNKINK